MTTELQTQQVGEKRPREDEDDDHCDDLDRDRDDEQKKKQTTTTTVEVGHFWARPSFKKNSDQIEKKN